MPDNKNLVQIILDASSTGVEQFTKNAEEINKSISKTNSSVRAADNAISSWKTKVAAAGAAVATAFAVMTREAIRTAQETQNLSESLQVSTRDIEALRAAARETGTDLKTVVSAFQQFQKIQSDMSAGLGKGNQQDSKAIGLMGLTIKDMEKNSEAANFIKVMKSMEQGSISGEKMAAGLKLFGESFRTLIPAARKGFGEVAQSFEDAHRNMETGTQDFLAKIGNLWDSLFGKLKGGAKTFAAETAAGGLRLAGLGAAAIVNVGAGLGIRGAAGLRDKMLLGMEQSTSGGSGEGSVEEREKILADKQSKRKTKESIASSKTTLRSLLGKDDADYVIEELDARSAKEEDYETAVRRAKRQSERRSKTDLRPKADELGQVGLFIGGTGGQSGLAELKKHTKQLADLNSKVDNVSAVIAAATADPMNPGGAAYRMALALTGATP